MTREEILRSMECVLESDKRTIKNPISEYGWLFDKIYKWKKSLEQELCEDCISRQAVLDMIENAQVITDGEFCGYCTEDIDINILPPVTPQQKVGKWIIKSDSEEFAKWTECSECGYKHNCITYEDKFCPNCGAKMEVSENE